jgi:hypothetical protein
VSDILGALIALRTALAIASYGDGAQNGVTVDALDAANVQWDDGVLSIKSGAITGAPDAVTVDVTIQHCDDGATWEDATDTKGTAYAKTAILDDADQLAVLRFDRQILKQYLRAVATVNFTGGAGPEMLLSADFIFGNAHRLPTA